MHNFCFIVSIKKSSSNGRRTEITAKCNSVELAIMKSKNVFPIYWRCDFLLSNAENSDQKIESSHTKAFRSSGSSKLYSVIWWRMTNKKKIHRIHIQTTQFVSFIFFLLFLNISFLLPLFRFDRPNRMNMKIYTFCSHVNIWWRK